MGSEWGFSVNNYSVDALLIRFLVLCVLNNANQWPNFQITADLPQFIGGFFNWWWDIKIAVIGILIFLQQCENLTVIGKLNLTSEYSW